VVSPGAATPAWSKLTIGGSLPAARLYAGAVYDPLGARLIVHGGAGAGGRLADVWQLNLANPGLESWSQIPAAAGPVARERHTLVYDSLRNRVLAYGGWSAIGYLSDTWALDLGTSAWTQLITGGLTQPGMRFGHGATYDSTNDRMIVFAGRYGISHYNDVFALSLAPVGSETWADISPTSGPTGRELFAFGASSDGSQAWVHGGVPGPYGDLWRLDIGAASSSWTQINFSGAAPLDRYVHSGCYDGAGRLFVGFGYQNGTELGDFWSIDVTNPGAGWSVPVTATMPAGLVATASAFDAANNRMIVYGGLGQGTISGGLWALDTSNPIAQWQPLSPSGTPPAPRRSATMVYDGSSTPKRMVVYGGWTGFAKSSITDEVWALELTPGSEAWVQLSPSVVNDPGPRAGHSAVVDTVGNRMIVFGGQNAAGVLGTTFALNLSTLTWTDLAPAGTAPGARFAHSAVYDSANNRMIVMSGHSGASAFADLHALSLAGTPTWSTISASGTAPGGRFYHSAVFDSANGRMLVFGGYFTAALGDVWELNVSTDTWTALPGTAAHPAARWAAATAYDSVGERMIIAGGYLDGQIPSMESSGALPDVWFFGK
ncbi:MAG: hypothetical protein OEY28_13300, partial [Nitrospira sp.]|nr:hypothetical protein [Nitrospira sp.]